MASYTLIGAITASQSVITVAPAWIKTGAYPCLMKCESEVVEVTGGEGTVLLSVNRGTYGTAAVVHATNTAIADATVTVS
jgi:hypothetical protein